MRAKVKSNSQVKSQVKGKSKAKSNSEKQQRKATAPPPNQPVPNGSDRFDSPQMKRGGSETKAKSKATSKTKIKNQNQQQNQKPKSKSNAPPTKTGDEVASFGSPLKSMGEQSININNKNQSKILPNSNLIMGI